MAKDVKRIVIDVSYHNGRVGWERVKAAGYHAILRMGYGDDIAKQDDAQWQRNLRECERLDIPHGAYLYSYAKSDAEVQSEIAHATRLLEGRELQYPVYIDVEQSGCEAWARETAERFCAAMEALGYWAGVYASQNWWQRYLGDLGNRYTPWVARYSDAAPVVAYDMWQYTDEARNIPGLNYSKCDFLACYRDFPAEIGGQAATADTTAHQQTTAELCAGVLAGSYGNGDERKRALGSRYVEVQALVNAVATASDTELAGMVAAGDFGNGDVRRKCLGSRYAAVQKIVNRMM